MNDDTVDLAMTEQDIEDLKALNTEDSLTDLGDGPSFHTVLQVWREVLKPALEERKKKATPQWATRICASYKEIYYADFADFKDRYYDKIEELYQMLLDVIDSDPECLNQETPAEDVEHNTVHYKTLIRDWQLKFLEWELAWSPDIKQPAIELAAIGEVHRMFLGDQGLLPFLESIQFQFTDEDREQLASDLEALREAAQ